MRVLLRDCELVAVPDAEPEADDDGDAVPLCDRDAVCESERDHDAD